MRNVSCEWVMSHIWRSLDSLEWVMIRMKESCLIWMSQVSYEWVMSHMNESCSTY